jgi:hypothetical protein
MELACACLDKPEDPFPGKRQYVLQCFQDVKAQQEQIGSLVEQASALLNEILQNEEVDYIKGRQFDNVIREARVLIESCKRRLTGAEQAISELSDKMGTVKWASRGLRATGMRPRKNRQLVAMLLRTGLNNVLLPILFSIVIEFVVTPRNFIIAKLSIRTPGSSSVPIIFTTFQYLP